MSPRQFSGNLGGVFLCQISVYVAWATSGGAASVDREVHPPCTWADGRGGM